MSKSKGNLYHPLNNHPLPIFTGFSWPCFFFGPFWFLYKGVWIWAILSFFAAWITFGISTIIFGFLGNGFHEKHLLKSGYLTSEKKEDNK